MRTHGLKIFKSLIRQCIHDAKRIDLSNVAASLAYISLLSIIPLTIICFSIFSMSPLSQGLNHIIQSFVFEHLVTPSATTIQVYFKQFLTHSQNLPWFSVCFLFLTGYFIFSKIEAALNKIWFVYKRRHGIIALPLYCITPVVVATVVGIAIFTSTYIFNALIAISDKSLSSLLTWLMFLGPYSLGVLTLTALYQLLPNRSIPFFCSLSGALVASILFEISKILVSIYFSYIKSYHIIYGTLVAVPIFLTWIYVLWTVVLFGAIVSHTIYLVFYSQHKAS